MTSESWKLSARKKTTLPGTNQSAEWARRKRAELIAELGGKCEECGETKRLEFHHKHIRQWVAAKKSRWMRMILYRREADAGEIALRCRHCNAVAGKPKNFSPEVLNTYETGYCEP